MSGFIVSFMSGGLAGILTSLVTVWIYLRNRKDARIAAIQNDTAELRRILSANLSVHTLTINQGSGQCGSSYISGTQRDLYAALACVSSCTAISAAKASELRSMIDEYCNTGDYKNAPHLSVERIQRIFDFIKTM